MKNNIKISLIIVVLLISRITWAQNQNVISLAPSYTSQIYNLKADKNLIAHTKYGSNITKDSSKVIIGSVVNINVEKIHSLKPDLILSSTLTRKKQLRQLEKLGHNIQTFQQPQNRGEIFKQYLKIAKFVNKQQLAQKQIEFYKDRIDSLNDILDTDEKNKPEVFFQIGSKPLYAAHQETYLNDLIELINCTNIVQSQNSGMYNREKVLSKNPDFILISLDEDKAQNAKQNWQKYNSLAAVKNDRIHLLDPNIFNTPTPKNFFLSLKKLTQKINFKTISKMGKK